MRRNLSIALLLAVLLLLGLVNALPVGAAGGPTPTPKPKPTAVTKGVFIKITAVSTLDEGQYIATTSLGDAILSPTSRKMQAPVNGAAWLSKKTGRITQGYSIYSVLWSH